MITCFARGLFVMYSKLSFFMISMFKTKLKVIKLIQQIFILFISSLGLIFNLSLDAQQISVQYFSNHAEMSAVIIALIITIIISSITEWFVAIVSLIIYLNKNIKEVANVHED